MLGFKLNHLSKRCLWYQMSIQCPPYTIRMSYRSSKLNCTVHYCDVIMSTMSSQITGMSIVYSTGWSGAYHRKHQISASLAFVCVWGGIHRSPVNSSHNGLVTRKIFSLMTSSSFFDNWLLPNIIKYFKLRSQTLNTIILIFPFQFRRTNTL